MSLEMEIPKILWFKKHMPSELFKQCMFFDLPDYLTYKATGSLARSNCSLVCKCSYIPPGVDGSELGWQPEFFDQIGLSELVKDDFKQLGGVPGRNGIVLTAGQPVGDGLTAEVAAELGLLPGTAVGSALIDAYAGWVGTVAAPATNPVSEANNRPSLISSQNRLAAIAGTSTCYCVQSPDGILVDGVWGPYKHAVFPGLWMNEGGQSSTGQLIDFIIDTHPAAPTLHTIASETNRSPFTVLHDKIDSLAETCSLTHASYLTKDLFIYPDFHGNRSPLADSQMRGMITGLKLDRSVADLALKYYATLEAIALQTRHIVEEMNAKGHKIDSIYMSGGHVKNPVFMQLIADVCDMPVQLPFSSSASVVAGSAILGRFAADVQDPQASNASGQHAPKEATIIRDQKIAEESSFKYKDHLWDLMVRMTKPGTLVFPQKDEKLSKLLDVKYKVSVPSSRIAKDLERAHGANQLTRSESAPISSDEDLPRVDRHPAQVEVDGRRSDQLNHNKQLIAGGFSPLIRSSGKPTPSSPTSLNGIRTDRRKALWICLKIDVPMIAVQMRVLKGDLKKLEVAGELVHERDGCWAEAEDCTCIGCNLCASAV